jgi:cytochrome c
MWFGGCIFLYKLSIQTIVNKIILKPNDKIITSLGKEIYTNNCASCHGKNLEGQPNWRERNDAGYLPAPPHDKTGHTWHHSDAYLF